LLFIVAAFAVKIIPCLYIKRIKIEVIKLACAVAEVRIDFNLVSLNKDYRILTLLVKLFYVFFSVADPLGLDLLKTYISNYTLDFVHFEQFI
jgi:hypothetical protein